MGPRLMIQESFIPYIHAYVGSKEEGTEIFEGSQDIGGGGLVRH